MNLVVLIADDNLVMRNLLKFYLGKLKIDTILEAEDGLEALKIIKEKEIDILFLDLMMPNLNGFNVANYVNAKSSEIVTVALSSDMSEKNVKVFKTLGVKYCLEKPISPTDINTVMNEILNNNDS
ncbi:MAG: response regulator [Campylobacteraceae bacterium]|nr:response regulator [Campylobacteraceae bacterium]